MRSENKIKTNDLFGSSFASAPIEYWKNVRNISTTSNNLCAILYPYFSTETGRQRQRKEFKIIDLRIELGNKNKLASRTAIENAVKEIKELGLFFVNENFIDKTKVFTFYLPSEKNRQLFDRVAKNESNLYLSISEKERENNIINIESHSLISESHSLLKNSHSRLEVNEIQKKENNSRLEINTPIVKSIVNSDLKTSAISPQDYYIKDNLLKKPLSLEEKLIEAERKVKSFFKVDEVKEEKEIMKDDHNLKNDIELDRIKSILVGQFGFYENIVEKFLTTKSIKCLDECIQSTITADENGEIKSNTRTYFKMKLENWVEKKDVVSSSPRSSEVVTQKVLVPGEKDFIDFCFSKKINFHISQNSLNASVHNILEREIENKAVILDLKANFTKEQIADFISNFKNTDNSAYKYTDKINLFWSFWNDISKMDEYIEKRKIEREEMRLWASNRWNNLQANKAQEVKETKVVLVNSKNDDEDDEVIPF